MKKNKKQIQPTSKFKHTNPIFYHFLYLLFPYRPVVQDNGFVLANIFLKRYQMDHKEVQTLYLFINLMEVWLNSPSHILKAYLLPQFPLKYWPLKNYTPREAKYATASYCIY